MAGKASIHSLPTETKAQIAELCHLQDETTRAVFARLRHHRHVVAPPPTALALATRKKVASPVWGLSRNVDPTISRS